jgi:hypothetical protein
MAQLALNGTVQIPLSVNYVTYTTSSSTATTYTFSGVSIKQPGLIVIGVHARKTGTGFSNLSSVTVNGVSATISENVRAVGDHGVRSALAYIRIDTGTTANIELTFSQTQDNVAISVYNIQGNLSDSPLGNSNSSSTSNVSVLNLNLTTSSVHPQVGIGICSNLGQNPAWYSTELGSLSTLYSDGFGPGTFRITGSLYKRGLVASGTTMLQCSTDDINRPSVLVAAVWR